MAPNKKGCGLSGLIPLFNTSKDEKVARRTLRTGAKISSAKCWGNTNGCMCFVKDYQTHGETHTYCIFTTQSSKCLLPLGHHGTFFFRKEMYGSEWKCESERQFFILLDSCHELACCLLPIWNITSFQKTVEAIRLWKYKIRQTTNPTEVHLTSSHYLKPHRAGSTHY